MRSVYSSMVGLPGSHYSPSPGADRSRARLLGALVRVFSWQETRLVSKSLTVHYERVLYFLDPTDAARAARRNAAADHAAFLVRGPTVTHVADQGPPERRIEKGKADTSVIAQRANQLYPRACGLVSETTGGS